MATRSLRPQLLRQPIVQPTSFGTRAYASAGLSSASPLRVSGRQILSTRINRRQYAATPDRPPSESNPSPPTESAPAQQAQASRRLPKWAQKYADRLKDHPGSHVTSFLILHEITAVLPLPLLFWLFHSFDWTPESIVTTPEVVEKGAKLAARQLERFGLRYTGDDQSRYVFEGAAAYAVVKVLLPLRIGLSLWLMPAFARRVVVPMTKIFRRKKAADGQTGRKS